MYHDNKGFEEILKERFEKLPQVVKNAILGAHVTEHLRALASNHKLHVDQWEILEHEVQMTLMGFKEASELAAHLQDELKLPPDEAHLLAQEIGRTVFEPIREQLERELEHPEAKEEQVSSMDATREGVLQQSKEATLSASAPARPVPATPPQPAPNGSAVRTADPIYISNTPSHERKTIEGDPYREQIA